VGPPGDRLIDLDQHLPGIVLGDDQAFAAWLAGAEPAVRGSLRSFAAAVDTEAVLQEALLRVWQVAPRVRPDGRPNSLLRMAVRIARNVAIDEVRRGRADPIDPAVLERVEIGGDPVPADPLLRRLVERCRAKLPEQPAKALTARLEALGGLSDRDLAAGLEMTVNTFLKNVGRARALLLECLARSGVTVEVP
jgi:RNA polymerase sigma-70 factor (ECF subfamily)